MKKNPLWSVAGGIMIGAAGLSPLVSVAVSSWSLSYAQPPGDRADGRSSGFALPVEVPRVLVTPISETEIPARVAGVLAETVIRVGDMVQGGAVLGHIDDAEAKMAEGLAEVELGIANVLAQAEPLVEAAEVAYEVAQNNLRRAEESLANFGKSISQAEMDDYRLKATEAKTALWEQRRGVEVAVLTQRLRRQQFELARDATGRHQIVSPVTGMIKEIDREVGEWVVPGQTIARVIRLDRLRCVGFLPADRVRNGYGPDAIIGRDAEFYVPDKVAGASRFKGTIVFLSPEIDPESDQIRVWVEVDNPDLRLRPGDRGTLVLDWPKPLNR
jgi:RND family efflux transporter MFP subunit